VIDALTEFYLQHNANVHRGVHLLGEEATIAFDEARETIRKFINAASADEIVFTHGTTSGINLLAQGWAAIRLQPGDEVLLTVMEHHSNIVPWQLARTASVPSSRWCRCRPRARSTWRTTRSCFRRGRRSWR
jgi:cysteine desulfurase/selenocysteine lyase